MIIIINLLQLQTYYLLAQGAWIAGLTCPFGGYLPDYFDASLGYTLSEAKERCSSGCIANPDCYYAGLYYTENWQTCYPFGSDCGDWYNNTHPDYHLFVKGIDLMSLSVHVSFEILLLNQSV